jgi:hypothetical protein
MGKCTSKSCFELKNDLELDRDFPVKPSVGCNCIEYSIYGKQISENKGFKVVYLSFLCFLSCQAVGC